ncbi:MAG: hypothetical protein FWD86_00030 [Firmicutes bacterium]|nr:hypothetical protein [Bacillota bacterium]
MGAVGAALFGGSVWDGFAEGATRGMVVGFAIGAGFGMLGFATNKVANVVKAKVKVANAPHLGNKLDYAFGNVKKNSHNTPRGAGNSSQLAKIGIHDNLVGRQIVANHFQKTFMVNEAIIMKTNGAVKVYSLLVGPGGLKGVMSVWNKNELWTFIFLGG